MNPMFGEWTLFSLGLTIGAGYLCVRILENRDIRRLALQHREQLKRKPQMRLFY
jgi:hypothetical protein